VVRRGQSCSALPSHSCSPSSSEPFTSRTRCETTRSRHLVKTQSKKGRRNSAVVLRSRLGETTVFRRQGTTREGRAALLPTHDSVSSLSPSHLSSRWLPPPCRPLPPSMRRTRPTLRTSLRVPLSTRSTLGSARPSFRRPLSECAHSSRPFVVFLLPLSPPSLSLPLPLRLLTRLPLTGTMERYELSRCWRRTEALPR